jgi:hypothetical protein
MIQAHKRKTDVFTIFVFVTSVFLFGLWSIVHIYKANHAAQVAESMALSNTRKINKAISQSSAAQSEAHEAHIKSGVAEDKAARTSEKLENHRINANAFRLKVNKRLGGE